MDFEENPELIFGEDFCFPTMATYYPTPYAPDEINLPDDLYEHQTRWGCGDQDLHCSGQQAEGTSCQYYVVPGYGIAHSPLGPYPSEPCVIPDGRFGGAQEYLAKTADITYHQPVPTPRYDVLPSAAQWGLASMSQTLKYTDSLFISSGQGPSFPVASQKGITRNQSLQSTSVSPKKIEDHAMQSKTQLHSIDPRKQDLAARFMVPAKHRRAIQASRHSLHVGLPSVKSSQQANSSYNYNASNVGSDLHKMVIAEKLQPSSKPRSSVNGFSGKLSGVRRQKIGEEKKPRGSMSPEIVVKSFTSKLHVGDPQGKIIIRTDQYNRDDFQLVHPNAKFFVIKSYSEANVHKSIKYGVWSSSLHGNRRLDSAFRDAQLIAASSSSLCPVFLFFSVTESSHFCGVAEMVGPVDFHKDMDFWSKHKWSGSFPVRWHIIKNIPNAALQQVLLQNNEDLPVTVSRDTQEIHYGPGTCMLKIFKSTRANECLLDHFTMYEEEEATGIKYTRSNLRRDAPRFIPVPKLYAARAYVPRQPKADRVLVDRIIRETHDLAGKLQHVNLDMQQEESTYAQKEDHVSYGKQAHEVVVKAVTYQPLASNIPATLNGGKLTWQEAEVANLSSEAPEEYPTEVKNALVHSAPAIPETIYEEKKIIGEYCSPAIGSQVSQAWSSCLIGDVLRVGSMLVPLKMSS
ncbi:unnamed protein product [Alopecurus aequalis]